MSKINLKEDREKRFAGDRFSKKWTKPSKEYMKQKREMRARHDRSAQEEGFRDNVERNRGTKWYDEALKAGLDKPTKGGAYTGGEVRAEMRAGRGDRTVDEMREYFQGLIDKGVKFNGNARDYLADKHGLIFDTKPKGGNKDPKPEGPNNDDPRDNTEDPVDTAPGTGPGAPDPIENWLPGGGWGDDGAPTGGGGGGGNVAGYGGANATGAGSTATGVYQGDVTNDIEFGDNAILNDVVFGNQSIVKNYGSGMSGGGGNGYGSALGNAAMYMDEAQDRFDNDSGNKYYLSTAGLGRNFALQNEYIDPDALSQRSFNSALAMMDLGNLYDTALYGQYQKPTRFIMPEDIEDDTDEQLERLQGLSD